MRNDFINDLKSVAMESIGIDVTVDPYAGSEVAEEMLTLDAIDNTMVAMESYTEALFVEAFGMQEIALESSSLTFGEIGKFNGELCMESIGNAIKRGAYEVKIQAKKVLQKIVQLCVSIFQYLTTASGKFKSYNKLFKKYREKLNKTNPAATTGDKEEKEISIRVWKDGFLEGKHKELSEASELVKSIRGVATAAINSDIKGTLTKIKETLTDAQLTDAADKVEKIMNSAESAIDDTLSDFKSHFKDALQEEKDEFKDAVESEEKKYAEAQSYLTTLAQKLETLTAKDLKFKSEFEKLRKLGNKMGAKDFGEDAARVVRILNKVSTPVLNGIRQGMTLQYKLLTSAYQGVLSDMAKVISAGTKVND